MTRSFRHRRMKSFQFAVIVLGSLALVSCGRSGGQQGFANRTPQVGVVTIRYTSAQLTTDLPGRTSPYEQADVRPQVNGILKSRLFTEGGMVQAGQPLYQIDPAPYQAAYDSAEATLANAEANLATTRAKAQRYVSLLGQNAIAKQDYDDAEAAYKQAEANVLQQTANLESAHINLGYTRITAPISGHIGRSLVTVGALATADQTTPLATIQRLDPIYVDISQSDAELLALKKAVAGGHVSGNTPATADVTLTLEDNSSYPLEGKLEFSEASVDASTGAVVLRAEFPNPRGMLLPGMYVRAHIVEGVDSHAILAPQQGISRDEKGEATAFIVDAHGVARQRVLQASRAIGSNWLVTSGLAPGDRLIVQGLQGVQPNQPVHAVAVSLASAAPVNGG